MWVLLWVVLGFLPLYGQSGSMNPFSNAAFVPDISFIASTSYVWRDVSDERYHQLEIPGFFCRCFLPGEVQGELHRNAGFNFNYGELNLYAAVDPYFDLSATISFHPEGAALEEAYVKTRGLPGGFQLKIGRFRSAFGRLNAQHLHVQEFSRPPLPYQLFLGEEGLSETGIHLNWVAPTDFYLLFVLELLEGTNSFSFGNEGFQIGTSEVRSASAPGLWVGTVKTSVDIGDLSLLTGVSYARGSIRAVAPDEEIPVGISGIANLGGVELTAKYFLDSYRWVALQSEYLVRTQRGTRYTVQDTLSVQQPFSRSQGGLYAQLVWRFHRRWAAGIQYNVLLQNTVELASQSLPLPSDLSSYRIMLEYDPSEYSRFRLQGEWDRSGFWEQRRQPVWQVLLEAIFAIGAHGAHPF